MKKTRRYGQQFWLYIVTNAGTDDPQMQRIQNPVTRFEMDEDIFATGFIIPEAKWSNQTSSFLDEQIGEVTTKHP
jgi:hypothetical protein